MSNAAFLAEIAEKRVAAGVCRHCAGPIPCYSEFGDREVGKKHTVKSLRAYRSELSRRYEIAAMVEEHEE